MTSCCRWLTHPAMLATRMCQGLTMKLMAADSTARRAGGRFPASGVADRLSIVKSVEWRRNSTSQTPLRSRHLHIGGLF